MRLAGKVCIVTGAAQGIGQATAEKFASEGAAVILCDLKDAELKALESKITQQGGKAATYRVDVTKRSEVKQVVDSVLQKFSRIDVLINNAGITRDARLVKMTDIEFDQVVDVNLRGVFLFCQIASEAMLLQGKGVILNASSVVGLYGNFGQTNYAATKFGVIGFTKTWARELGPKGIRVNAVAPGYTETPILESVPEKVLVQMRERVPLKRLGSPVEIANAYAFLASDEASYINGAVLEVTGGLTI